MAAPGQQRRLSRWETARQNHANAPYPEPRTKLRERPRGGFASLGPSLASSRGGAELGAPAAALARFRAPPAPGAGGGPSRARPAAIQEAERGPGAAAAPRPAPRRAGLCPAALPVRAGGGAAREAPPRPRRRAARRARLATPSRAGPGARAYSSPPPRRTASSPGRPQRRAPRTPDSPGGCWCWPWAPPGQRGPRSGRPLRSQRTAAEPEPMGRPHPPPVTSPTTIPPLPSAAGRTSARSARSLVAPPATRARGRAERPPVSLRVPSHAEHAWWWG